MKSDFLASVRTAVAVLTLLALPARAGGPIGLCDTGAPMLWPGGGVSIPFNPDLGNLGPSLDNAAAVALVQSSFDVWGDLPSSTASYLNAGPLPEDVDINNFGPYLSPGAPDGYSAIVFDDTGEIFDLVFGAGSGILGFAGPEWIDFTTCTILEGVSFLNGPAFTDPVYAFDVMVHEFGHYSGLAHTVVNGQIYLVGDATGPAPDNATFGFAPDPFADDVLETMYPYYFGPGIGTGSPERDDIASLSTLYPEPGFATTTGTLTGVIYAPDGVTPLTGVNVIARNLADPFHDAVSAISGDYSYFYGDAFTGHFTLRGLTPGASYAVYIDQIVAGGFSAPVISLPGVEEFYNGVNESNNLITTDTPSDYTAVSAAAGATTAGVNIIINGVKPGDPLPVGDEGSYELFLPFPFTIVGQTYHSVFVNANGNLTFGAAAPFPDYFPDAYGLLNGPPRIAGLWADLDASAGGVVTFGQTATTFTVYWKNVPSYFIGGDNTFSITLRKTGNVVEIKYGSLTATDGVAGLSGGFATTSGLETPIDLTPAALKKTRLSLWLQPAIFEVFDAGNPFDLAGKTSLCQHDYDYNDKWAGANNSFATAKPISLPFDSSTIKYYTEIAPTGADVDFFKFHVNAGDLIKVELTRGAFDSVAGIFAPDGTLIAVDDDSGVDLLSKVAVVAPTDGTYAVGISAFSDFDFTGAGGSGGRYVLKVETISLVSSPANWLVNGSFETGAFDGWTAFESSSIYFPLSVVDSSVGIGYTFAEPQDGNYDAGGAACSFCGGFEPVEVYLYQEATIPAGEPFLQLEWKERIQWGSFLDPAETHNYWVLIVNPADFNVLRVVRFLDTTGSDLGYNDTGWLSLSYDVSEFIGQTIGLLFYQEFPPLFNGAAQYEFDDVKLRSQ